MFNLHPERFMIVCHLPARTLVDDIGSRANPVLLSTVSGDLRAGNVFLQPVPTLVEETIPSVSAPPGNSGEFQARAALLLREQKPLMRILFAFHHE
jgi:hypothetical protein